MTNDLQEYIEQLEIQEFRLVSGEHVVAEIIDESDDTYSVKDPILVERISNMQTFSEWFPYSDNTYFGIDKDHIIGCSAVDFHTKVMFCRLITTNNLKKELSTTGEYDSSEVEMLEQLTALAGMVDGHDPVIDNNNDWSDDVDTNVVH